MAAGGIRPEALAPGASHDGPAAQRLCLPEATAGGATSLPGLGPLPGNWLTALEKLIGGRPSAGCRQPGARLRLLAAGRPFLVGDQFVLAIWRGAASLLKSAARAPLAGQGVPGFARTILPPPPAGFPVRDWRGPALSEALPRLGGAFQDSGPRLTRHPGAYACPIPCCANLDHLRGLSSPTLGERTLRSSRPSIGLDRAAGGAAGAPVNLVALPDQPGRPNPCSTPPANWSGARRFVRAWFASKPFGSGAHAINVVGLLTVHAPRGRQRAFNTCWPVAGQPDRAPSGAGFWPWGSRLA